MSVLLMKMMMTGAYGDAAETAQLRTACLRIYQLTLFIIILPFSSCVLRDAVSLAGEFIPIQPTVHHVHLTIIAILHFLCLLQSRQNLPTILALVVLQYSDTQDFYLIALYLSFHHCKIVPQLRF
jgi:hypothetical protein